MAAVATEPGALAVPLCELMAFLRIGNGEEEALLAGLARGASETCEAFTGRALIVREMDEVLAASAEWSRLAAAPVRSIEQVAALAVDGTPGALPADAFAIDIDAAGEGWVRLLRPIDEKRIRVRYRAGLADDPSGLPEAIRAGIVRLAAHLFTHRDMAPGAVPAAVTALWRPWRRLRLG